MPIVIIGAFLAVVIAARARSRAGSQAAQSTSPETAPSDSGSAPNVGGAAGTVAAIAAGAIVGAEVGHEAAVKVYSADPGDAKDVTATVGGALVGVSIACAAIGVTGIGFPVAVIVFAIVAVSFLLVSFIEDSIRSQPGVAAREYEKLWDKTYSQVFQNVRANPNYSSLSDKQLIRYVTPIVDGICLQLNELKFKSWMARSYQPDMGNIGKPESPLAHAERGVTYAHFFGGVELSGGQVILRVDPSYIHSKRKGFAEQYCPYNEQKRESKVSTRVIEDPPLSSNPITIAKLMEKSGAGTVRGKPVVRRTRGDD